MHYGSKRRLNSGELFAIKSIISSTGISLTNCFSMYISISASKCSCVMLLRNLLFTNFNVEKLLSHSNCVTASVTRYLQAVYSSVYADEFRPYSCRSLYAQLKHVLQGFFSHDKDMPVDSSLLSESISDPLLTIPSSAERKASGSVLTNFGNE